MHHPIQKLTCNALAILALSVNVASAKPLASDITFPGGTIAPTESYSIPLNKLVAGISYDLTCKLENKSNDNIIFSVNPYYAWAYLDGKYFQMQTALISGKHELKIEYVGKPQDPLASDKIHIINADQENSILVEGCKATAR